MPTPRISELRVEVIRNPDAAETKNAQIVLDGAIKSANEFYSLYQTTRRGSRGTTTHQQQDLLRAMLVFACSGLDAVIKQLVKDALPKIINSDEGAQNEFGKFIDRSLRKNRSERDLGSNTVDLDTKLLAEVLSSPEPRDKLILLLQDDLRQDSLQSRDQILKAASSFAIQQGDIMDDIDTTKSAFDIRNQIIHEMDVDLAGRKSRRQRTATVMIRYCENIFNISTKFINTVSDKLSNI